LHIEFPSVQLLSICGSTSITGKRTLRCPEADGKTKARKHTIARRLLSGVCWVGIAPHPPDLKGGRTFDIRAAKPVLLGRSLYRSASTTTPIHFKGDAMNPFSSKQPFARLALLFAVSLSLLSGNLLAREMTYSTKMGPVLSRTVFTPGDKSGHELVQAVRTDMTSGADPDWNETSVTNYGQSDLVDGSGTVSGYAVRTHKNGDKTYYRYEGKFEPREVAVREKRSERERLN
jgi:hypothetical protein